MTFLNRLFCSTDLKSANFLAPKGDTKNIYFARGESQCNIPTPKLSN
jgi:hypothetical protein